MDLWANGAQQQIPPLQESEWTKGKLFTPARKRHCLLAHISILHSQPTSLQIHRQMYDALTLVITELFPERTQYGIGNISYFNDHPRTTYSDVCKVIEEANRRLAA